MLVFLSWSGARSGAVAEALREWLRDVIQCLHPWMSKDIETGMRWSAAIAEKLEKTHFGIVVATPENLAEPWINFEAGACAKLGASRVSPFLVGLDKTQVAGPLAQFQMVHADREGARALVKSLNSAVGESGGNALSEARLQKAFEQYWGQLEAKIQEALKLDTATPPRRDQGDLLEEILGIVRSLERRQGVRLHRRRRRSTPSLADVVNAPERYPALAAALARTSGSSTRPSDLWELAEAFAEKAAAVLPDEATGNEKGGGSGTGT